MRWEIAHLKHGSGNRYKIRKPQETNSNRGIKTGTMEYHTCQVPPWYAFVLSPMGRRLFTYVYPLLNGPIYGIFEEK
jgi:hypothetical protein